MKLESVEVDNYRAIEHLCLPLHPSLTVLHGGNTCGKTSVLSAIAALKDELAGMVLRTGKRIRPSSCPLLPSMTPTGRFSIFRRVGAAPAATFLPTRYEWREDRSP